MEKKTSTGMQLQLKSMGQGISSGCQWGKAFTMDIYEARHLQWTSTGQGIYNESQCDKAFKIEV